MEGAEGGLQLHPLNGIPAHKGQRKRRQGQGDRVVGPPYCFLCEMETIITVVAVAQRSSENERKYCVDLAGNTASDSDDDNRGTLMRVMC